MSTEPLFISLEKLIEAKTRFLKLTPAEYQDATKIFEECGPGNTLNAINRPYDRFHDYELMLKTMRDVDEEKYIGIHKGTPFYFLAWTAFYMKDFEKAVFYMDAAISEDKKNFPDKWDKGPAAYFLTLSDRSAQSARMITKDLKAQLEEQFRRFNNISRMTALTIDSFVTKFVHPLLKDHEARTILTALYSFILEYNDRYEMLKLRGANRGTIEPFLVYLFKGGLIFESLLKYTNRGTKQEELGKCLNDPDIIKKYGIETQDIFRKDLKNNLKKIIESSKNESGINVAFSITFYIRNLTGHDLKRQDEFSSPDDFHCLHLQIINAFLFIIVKEVAP